MQKAGMQIAKAQKKPLVPSARLHLFMFTAVQHVLALS